MSLISLKCKGVRMNEGLLTGEFLPELNENGCQKLSSVKDKIVLMNIIQLKLIKMLLTEN